jgi:hypothetical protein
MDRIEVELFSPVFRHVAPIATAIVLAIAVACTPGASEPTAVIPDIRPSGPLVPGPAGLWQPPPGSTPATGNYVYIEMDSSFSTGVTYPQTMVPVLGSFSVTWRAGKLAVTATDPVVKLTMSGVFQTMLGLTELKEGYYGDLRGLSDADPLAGALAVSLNAQECRVVDGWFMVDHVFYFTGGLTQVDLRFEERCSTFGAPMHGQIHWREGGFL